VPTTAARAPTTSSLTSGKARPSEVDSALDNLIREVTVDARDDDEQLMGFEAAFVEDASFPCTRAIVGEEVQVLSVSRTDNRHEPIATCRRRERLYTSLSSTSTSTQT
jgi:hypothetical protein